MTAYNFLALLFVLLLFVIALWRQSGILFIIAGLTALLLGLLGRLETWQTIANAGIGIMCTVIGTIKLLKGDF